MCQSITELAVQTDASISANDFRLLNRCLDDAIAGAVTVSPRGGLVLCEDGGGDEFLHGLTLDGQIFTFAQNNVTLRGERNGLTGDFTHSEWAGPCYSPDGKWLFANIFDPGITVAITGPWQSGAL